MKVTSNSGHLTDDEGPNPGDFKYRTFLSAWCKHILCVSLGVGMMYIYQKNWVILDIIIQIQQDRLLYSVAS